MRGRMERCFSLHSNRENPYARALLLGDMPSAQNAEQVGSIQLVCADAAAFLEDQPSGSFTGFSLSNILDGANAAYEERLFAAVCRAAAPGAVVVLRSFREPALPTQTNRALEDRSMLWGTINTRPATAL
jgi:S-adenosylmethionine:diacylglycerol 3-amino-3-carboxypropyl transferase